MILEGVRWVALFMLCGCTAVFGIDPLPAPEVIGTLEHRWLDLDASSRPQFELEPYAAGDTPIEVRDATGALLAVSWQPTKGTFSFRSGDSGTYRVLVTAAGIVTEYQSASPQLALAATELGHPDDVAPGAGAEIDVTPDTMLTGQARVLTTGVWMTGPSGSTTVPMAMFAPQFLQAPALPRAAVHDRVVLLDYTEFIPLREGVASVDVAANAPTPVSVTMQPVPMMCATFATHHSTDIARLKQKYSDFTATEGQAVTVVATAKPELGLTASYTEGGTVINDDQPTVQYGIPSSFAAMATLATSAAAISRNVEGIALYGFIHHYHLLTPEVACTTTVIDEDEIALPVHPALGGTPLTTDDQVIAAAPASPLELTFDLDGAQANAFHVSLYKVANGAATLVRLYVTTQPRVLIDPMILEPGTHYMADIAVVTGFPAAAAGDFRDMVYPSARGDLETPVFSITR